MVNADDFTSSLLVPAMRRDLSMRAIETQIARVQDADLSAMVVADIDHVPASVLPFIAQYYGLYGDIEWELARTETQKRELLKVAMHLNRKCGTAWALKTVFKLLGLGDVTIEQGRAGWRRGTGRKRGDRFHTRGNDRFQWSAYRVIVPSRLTVEQSKIAFRLAEKWSPARSHLHSLTIDPRAKLIRNGFARRDRQYTRGTYYL